MANETETSTALKIDSVGDEGVIDVLGDGGLLKRITKEGQGDVIESNCLVKVYYKGTLLDGTQFDANESGPGFEFTLGKGSVIKGWEEGLATMKVGEKATFTIGPEYAYGESGSGGTIPPNATLKFDVELLSAVPKMTTLDKVEYGTPIKEEGNALFKEQKYDEAQKKYEEVLDLFEENEGLSLPDEDWQKVNKLLTSCHLNLGAIFAIRKDWSALVWAGQKAIDDNENHAKAHFRRGQGYLGLNDFAAAKEDLTKAAKLAPNDAAIRRELARLKAKKDKYRAKEAARAKAAFGAGGLYDDVPDPTPSSSDSAAADDDDNGAGVGGGDDKDDAGESGETVEVSETIGASADKVWGVFGNFGDLTWHPEVESTEGLISDGSATEAGAQRRFVGSAGATHTQELTAYDAVNRVLKVKDVSVVPNIGYNAMAHTVTVAEGPRDNTAQVTYSVTFTPAKDVAVNDLATESRRIIGKAFAGVRARLGVREDPTPKLKA